MTTPDTDNDHFQLAVNFVNHTSKHIFLTGKAGTGKTTFLKYITEHTQKKAAVVAPTGVAAINAGGVTMHSFFQLPFGAYLPTRISNRAMMNQFTDQHTLFSNLRLNAAKRELLQELELLIIDEVSMVRADMLDATDAILRHFRHQPLLPFGGVQVLYIGDLFQLPPVVNTEEWEVLSTYYRSMFFFDAFVIKECPPVFLELKKIYRQSDSAFIDILNNIRNNSVTRNDLLILNSHFKQQPDTAPDEKYITLTTHNHKADTINQANLKKLPGAPVDFRAEISGEFQDKAMPADETLRLKTGAQVMFIKNDKGEVRRYYNGKIATVSRIEKDKIFVRFPGESTDFELMKETWRNIRYAYNKDDDHIDEEELGSFKQYPIRLAWAITIHKSQGLTFDKAIIDAGESFAAGQVYVALSRLTQLSGLILLSRIHPQSISTDQRVLAFAASEMDMEKMREELKIEKQSFISQTLLQSFNYAKLTKFLQDFFEEFEHRVIPEKEAARSWCRDLQSLINEQADFAVKFIRQAEWLLRGKEAPDYRQIHERVKAAHTFFTKSIDEALKKIYAHHTSMKIKQRVKKYLAELSELELLVKRKKYKLAQALVISEALMQGTDAAALLDEMEQKKKYLREHGHEEARVQAKPKKGETRRISLELFKAGKSISEIAGERGMAPVTIEGHLVTFIPTGEVLVQDLVAKDKMDTISKVLDESGDSPHGIIKSKLGDRYSYSEIKAVIAWKELSNFQSEKAK